MLVSDAVKPLPRANRDDTIMLAQLERVLSWHYGLHEKMGLLLMIETNNDLAFKSNTPVSWVKNNRPRISRAIVLGLFEFLPPFCAVALVPGRWKALH